MTVVVAVEGGEFGVEPLDEPVLAAAPGLAAAPEADPGDAA